MTQTLLSQLPYPAVLLGSLLDRDELIEQLAASLSQPVSEIPILIGARGSGRTIFLSQFAQFWQQQNHDWQIVRLDFSVLAKQSKESASTSLMSIVMALKIASINTLVCFDELESLVAVPELNWLLQWAIEELKQVDHLSLVVVVERCFYEKQLAGEQTFHEIEVSEASKAQTKQLLRAYLSENEAIQWLDLAKNFSELLIVAAKQVANEALPGSVFHLLKIILRDCAASTEVIGERAIQLAVAELNAGVKIKSPTLTANEKLVHKLIEAFPQYKKQMEELADFLKISQGSSYLPLVLFHGEEVGALTKLGSILQEVGLATLDVTKDFYQQVGNLSTDVGVVWLEKLSLANSDQMQVLLGWLKKKRSEFQTQLEGAVVMGLFEESSLSSQPVPLLQLVVTDMPQPTALSSVDIYQALPEKLLALAKVIEISS